MERHHLCHFFNVVVFEIQRDRYDTLRWTTTSFLENIQLVTFIRFTDMHKRIPLATNEEKSVAGHFNDLVCFKHNGI